jgi:hypothetical protein
MARNWGLPVKADGVFRKARSARPMATLGLSALYGIIGAAVAAIAFNDARALWRTDLFHGLSLIMAVVIAGFGCWLYVWLARPRFAAHFAAEGDAFSDLLRFYARGAIGLGVALLVAKLVEFATTDLVSVLILCAAGGAGAAAAFQTVLAFVPGYDGEEKA